MPDRPSLPLTWYFDPISPFAYLALRQVERLAAQHPVTYVPIVFGAVLSHWGQLGPAEIAPKRTHTYRLCQFLADQAGLPFRFPPSHPFRSLDALRLLAATGDEGGADHKATRLVFDFIWAEGRNPSPGPEMDALAERVSRPAIPSQADKDRLHAWTDQAIAAGIFGVPTLAIGPELFWGVDALPFAATCLADPSYLQSSEMARLVTLPSGVTRKGRPE